jgi:methylmalonyl-CoA mutase cobalamin-binding domain/chain
MANTPSPTRIRVVVAKPGLDGHDRGAKIMLI